MIEKSEEVKYEEVKYEVVEDTLYIDIKKVIVKPIDCITVKLNFNDINKFLKKIS